MQNMSYIYKKIKRVTQLHTNDTLLVCFDYFDTIVSRRFSPEEIKKAWAKKCIEEYSLPLAWQELYESRIKCESSFYEEQSNNHEFRYEELITSIFDLYKNIFPQQVGLTDFQTFSIWCEKTIETKSQRLNDDIKKAIEYCFENGLKIAIVSDFYFGKEVIKEFLVKHGIDKYFSGVFISCDYYKSKRFGDLYEEVKKANPGCSYVMVGDNYQADYLRAQEHGFTGVYIARKRTKKDYDSFDRDSFKYVKKKLEELYSAGSALSNYVFALYLFVERLYEKAREGEIRDLYFLSRDGELLKQLFDLYLGYVTLDYKINTHYLLVSRNATYLPACRPLNEESFDGIMMQYKQISISDFLYSLSFSDDQIKRIIQELTCNENSILCKSPDNQLWTELMENENFAILYEYNRKRQREAFGKYIRSEINNLNSFAIVDVGWKGSIQNNIYNYLDEESKIVGLYFGLTMLSERDQQNEKHGLVFAADDKANMDYLVFSFQSWFLESILTGSHPKVSHYEKTEKGVEIRYEEDSDKKLYELIIKKIREEIINKYKEICVYLNYTHFSAEDFIDTFRLHHFRLTRFYPVFHMKQNYIITEMHSEGFGSIRNITEPQRRAYIKYFFSEFGIKYSVSSFARFVKLKRQLDARRGRNSESNAVYPNI